MGLCVCGCEPGRQGSTSGVRSLPNVQYAHRICTAMESLTMYHLEARWMYIVWGIKSWLDKLSLETSRTLLPRLDTSLEFSSL